MATTASASSSIPNRPTYSCIRCAERKVKCDRQRPCSTCVKRNVDCVFNPSQAPRKRHRRVKEQILTDRLRHYEALLQQQGLDPSKLPVPVPDTVPDTITDNLPDTPDSNPRRGSSQTVAAVPEESQLQTPSSIESEPSGCVNKTQLLHGQGRFKFVDK